MGEFIRVKDAFYRYPSCEDWAINGLTMSISDGEYVAIMGSNGSGKSTLVRMLNGLLKPQRGRVLVDGQETVDEVATWAIRAKVAVVFQNPDNQLVAARVEEDVAFGPENLGLEPGEIRIRVEEALGLMGLIELRHYPPHLLSGGQKQRLAIAGAMAMKPQVLVLDEPTSMLDPQGRREVLEAIGRLNRDEGLTVVHVTHSPEEAALAGRVMIIDSGKVALDGVPGEVFSQGKLLQEYGLAVPVIVNITDGLRIQGVAVPKGIIGVDEMVEWLWPLL
ncbi:MAG: energy-coupling factor transporter ATPase [Clostridia bacterium]|nr:energy-coupling factor transporter ATPase [Clostridia bacterium]